MKKKLFLLLAALALIVALFAGMALGCASTRKNAVLVSDDHDGYIISYRFGGYWLNEYYETEAGIEQAKRHSDFMTDYANGVQARQNKAKTSKWFVKAISPEKEELIFISSKEPNQYFGRDISLRSRMKNVGDKWIPTKRSPLYGWQFEAIEKYEF